MNGASPPPRVFEILVADVHAGRACFRIEHLHQHGRQDRLHGDAEQHEPEDLAEPDQPHVAGAEEHEARVDHAREADAPDDVDRSAPDPVRDRSPRGRDEDLQNTDDHGSGEAHPRRYVLVADHEREAVGQHDVARDRLRKTDQDAHDGVLRMPERLDQRVRLLACRLDLQRLSGGELLGLLELTAEQNRHDRQHDREQERKAPSPAEEP